MCGMRAKISAILPASLRAGTITETEGRLTVGRLRPGPGDDDIGQGQVFERPKFDQKTVGQIRKKPEVAAAKEFLVIV